MAPIRCAGDRWLSWFGAGSVLSTVAGWFSDPSPRRGSSALEILQCGDRTRQLAGKMRFVTAELLREVVL
jgi:hypothetical protein